MTPSFQPTITASTDICEIFVEIAERHYKIPDFRLLEISRSSLKALYLPTERSLINTDNSRSGDCCRILSHDINRHLQHRLTLLHPFYWVTFALGDHIVPKPADVKTCTRSVGSGAEFAESISYNQYWTEPRRESGSSSPSLLPFCQARTKSYHQYNPRI